MCTARTAETLVIEGAGNDHDVAGASGLYGDLLTYESASQPLTMHLATNSALVGDDHDTVVGFDTYYGTDDNDLFTGTDEGDRFLGGGGNDDISGYGGDDYFVGNIGNDTIFGGAGDDNLQGWKGFDHLTRHVRNNNVSDYALTGVSGAVITTGPGNDVVATEATTLRRITPSPPVTVLTR
ncbi:MAG: hypothetical protein H0U28_14200 [Nocardioidaceae bacterium]|nr:hypothetical protein [Nocardioidaceae bacterium]